MFEYLGTNHPNLIRGDYGRNAKFCRVQVMGYLLSVTAVGAESKAASVKYPAFVQSENKSRPSKNASKPMRRPKPFTRWRRDQTHPENRTTRGCSVRLPSLSTLLPATLSHTRVGSQFDENLSTNLRPVLPVSRFQMMAVESLQLLICPQ